MVFSAAVHRCAEPLADLGYGCCRGDRQPQLLVDVSDQTSPILQSGDVDIGVYPVDATNLENHVIVKDIGNTAR